MHICIFKKTSDIDSWIITIYLLKSIDLIGLALKVLDTANFWIIEYEFQYKLKYFSFLIFSRKLIIAVWELI